MRSSLLLALPIVVAAGCSAEQIGAHQEADTLTGSVYITQVYGGGGNSGATYDHDYIELSNLSADDATLSAYSVFYRSKAGSTWVKTDLPANLVIPAGGNYLVTEAGTVGTGTAIVGDTTDSINLASGNGVIALATTATALSGVNAPAKPAVGGTTVDLVGYGSGTTLFDGTVGPAPGPSTNTKAVVRTGETHDNSVDFVLGAPAPVRAATSDDGGLDMEFDMTKGPDMVVTDAGPYTAALNEVKWNPAGSDNGQEFIELIGTGTLPPHTFVVSVSGDAEAKNGGTVGRINYAYDVSATPFGSNGLILIKATATTFPGVPSATMVLDDVNLNTAKLGNFTETAMLIQVNDPVATPIVTGDQIPTSTAYTILDSLAVREPTNADAGVTTPDPIYGTAVLEACASELPGKIFPPSGASRIVGNTTTESASAWYAGQAYGISTDQYLSNVADCSTSGSPPQTWSMSPGLPNNMPEQPAPDLLNAPIIDLSTPSDDLAGVDNQDFAATFFDMAHVTTNDGGGTVKPGGNIGGSGCAAGGHGSLGWTSALLLAGLAWLLRGRRRAS